jgi:hypothetical protein
MRIQFIRLLAGALGALLPAWALAVSFTGTLTAGGPTMPVVSISTPNCVSQGVTPVLYRTYPFNVSASGSYTFTVDNNLTAIYIHAGAFNPASPFANCIAASNSNPINLPVNLNSGTNYFLTIIDDTFAQTGQSFVAEITGPGTITVNGSCSDFTDVLVSSTFCASVQWLKNRAVTTGCTSTLYCPNDNVTRAQMALFMNRLGNALQPVFLHMTQSGAASVVNAGGVVCQTSDYAVTGYPRVATPGSVMIYHAAPATLQVRARLVYSLDAGTAWQDFGSFYSLAANSPGQFTTQTPAAGPRIFSPGQTVRFGIRATPVPAPGTANDAGCEMTVRIESTTGVVSPFDLFVVDQAPAGPRPSAN